MNNLKNIFFFVYILILGDKFIFAQDYKVDTVNVDGYLVTYINKKDRKSQIDRTRGYFFFTRNQYDFCQMKRKSEKLFEIDRKQNAIFLLEYGGSFLTLNSFFFNGSLTAMKLNETHYPTKKKYSFKDRKYLYRFQALSVKCLKVTMSEKELIHFIPYNQYTFNLDKIPVYIIQEVVKNE
jgi:hypothetical protein